MSVVGERCATLDVLDASDRNDAGCEKEADKREAAAGCRSFLFNAPTDYFVSSRRVDQ